MRPSAPLTLIRPVIDALIKGRIASYRAPNANWWPPSNPQKSSFTFHIVNKHPFLDGNKRTGAVSALVFLALNGYDFTAPQKVLAETVFAVAGGELAKADLTVFIRKWAVRRQL